MVIKLLAMRLEPTEPLPAFTHYWAVAAQAMAFLLFLQLFLTSAMNTKNLQARYT